MEVVIFKSIMNKIVFIQLNMIFFHNYSEALDGLKAVVSREITPEQSACAPGLRRDSCRLHPRDKSRSIIATANKFLEVNIFVHGTVKPYLKVRNLATIFSQNDITDSAYATFNNYVRNSKILNNFQAMQELGFKKIDTKNIFNGNGACAMTHLYSFFDQKEKDRLFYTFGWSGLLSYKLREKEGITLYNKIKKLVKNLKKEGFEPKINVIGFSHGGTVILNMAKARHQRVKINKTILIGMPVQKDTDYLINSPIFKKIYHFYSDSDYVQKIDLASSEYFSCHRRFAPRKDFKLPEKLIQIRLEVTKNILNKCLCKHQQSPLIKQTYQVNPGHLEMWSFGWSGGYRKRFPLYPIPMVAFTPFIINAIERLQLKNNHLSININDRNETLTLTDLRTKTTYVEPFISFSTLEDIKEKLENLFAPENHVHKLKSHVKKAAQKESFYKHDPCRLNCCYY